MVFEYTAYNENGGRIDSTRKQGRPARTRLGIQGMIPGFEEGIKSMRQGGKRRARAAGPSLRELCAAAEGGPATRLSSCLTLPPPAVCMLLTFPFRPQAHRGPPGAGPARGARDLLLGEAV